MRRKIRSFSQLHTQENERERKKEEQSRARKERKSIADSTPTEDNAAPPDYPSLFFPYEYKFVVRA